MRECVNLCRIVLVMLLFSSDLSLRLGVRKTPRVLTIRVSDGANAVSSTVCVLQRQTPIVRRRRCAVSTARVWRITEYAKRARTLIAS